MNNKLKIFIIIFIGIFFILLASACNADKYSLTFDANGGEFGSGESTYIMKISGTSSITFEEKPPKRVGFRFEGWYVDNETFLVEFTTDYFNYLPEKGDMIIYAKWSAIASYYIEGIQYALLNCGTSYSVINYKGSSEEVMVPDSYLNKPVKEIGYQAFSGCLTLKKITLPDSIVKINESAFNGCYYLERIIFGEDSELEVIEKSAFSNCSNLDNIILPNNITAINELTFNVCTNLRSIRLPDSLLTINDNAFNYCSNLVELTVPSKLTSIGQNSFSLCINLRKIIFPEDSELTDIRENAFINCNNNLAIMMNKKVPPNLGKLTFYYQKNNFFYIMPYLKIFVPEDNLESYKTAPGWSKYNKYIYSKSIIDEKGYAINNGKLIYYEGNESNIILPNNITSISGRCFYDATNLKSFVVESDNIVSLESEVFNSDNVYLKLYLPHDKVNSYKQSNEWKKYKDIIYSSAIIDEDGFAINDNVLLQFIGNDVNITIPDDVTKLANYAFKDNINLSRINLPRYLTEIGQYAFDNVIGEIRFHEDSIISMIDYMAFGNYKGQEIILPDSITNIYYSPFYNCTELERVYIPKNVIHLSSYSFNNCPADIIVAEENAYYKSVDGVLYNKNLSTLIKYPEGKNLSTYTIPSNVTSIGSYAFYNSKLETMIIPNRVKDIGSSAFSNCISLTSISLPDDITSIEDYVFNNCSELEGIIIPDSVEYIGVYTFYNCSKLVSIIIPESVEAIGRSAFSECTSLINITVSDNAIYIGQHAFKETAWLSNKPGGLVYLGKVLYLYNQSFYYQTEATLLEDTIGIASYAFDNNYYLTKVTIPASIEYIGSHAFNNCMSLTTVVIYNAEITFGDFAFSNCKKLTSFTIESTVPPPGHLIVNHHETLKIYVPISSKQAYKEAWISYSDRIEAIPNPQKFSDLSKNLLKLLILIILDA